MGLLRGEELVGDELLRIRMPFASGQCADAAAQLCITSDRTAKAFPERGLVRH